MISLLLLGTPSTFECEIPHGQVPTQNPYCTSPNGESQLGFLNIDASPSHSLSLDLLLREICTLGLNNTLPGPWTRVFGMSQIEHLHQYLGVNPEWSSPGLCLLLASFKPQEPMAEWRQSLNMMKLPYQVIHGSIESMNERVLHALSAHVQMLGLAANVMRPMPKERPRLMPCECCASAECEKRLFDFLSSGMV
jgi:hypothetical protein